MKVPDLVGRLLAAMSFLPQRVTIAYPEDVIALPGHNGLKISGCWKSRYLGEHDLENAVFEAIKKHAKIVFDQSFQVTPRCAGH